MPRSLLARLLLCGVLMPSLALAEPIAPVDETLRLLEHERRQREASDRLDRLRQSQHQRPAVPPLQSSPVTDLQAPCWPVPGLSLSGNRLLKDPALAKAVKPQLKRCMGAAAVRRVLATVTEAYVNKGYIAARAYLGASPQPGQPLAILIEEGFVESIELADDDLNVSLASAFPGMIGRPLYLPQLEQGLDQLNRLRSVNLVANIEPGAMEGGSRLVLRSVTRQSPLAVNMSYRNAGAAATGRDALTLRFGLDNALGLNDQVSLTLAHTLGSAPNYSNAFGLRHEVPYGPWTLATSFYHSEQFAVAGSLNSRYLSEQTGLRIDRVLWRNQQAIVSAGLRLDHKNTRRHIGHINLREPDPSTTAAQAYLDLLWIGRTSLAAHLSYAKGLDWLGANPRPASNTRPQPRFEQYRAQLNHTWPWGAWLWESALDLQYSPDLLPGTEQLSLASSTAIRGYRDSNVSASSAAVWRNELRLRYPLLPKLTLYPHLAVDYGRGWLTVYGKKLTPTLAGISGGATLAWPGGTLKLDYQKSLTIKDTPPTEAGFWNTELSLLF